MSVREPAPRGLAVATVVAKNRLALARVLADSFTRYHPDVPFFVLLADEPQGFLDPAAERFEVLRLEELAVDGLDAMLRRCTQQEFSYAMTPHVLRALLDRGFRRAVFLKQESLVTGDLSPAFDLLSRHQVVLVPHLLASPPGPDAAARERVILQSGTFNVGFLGVSEGATARAFLSWWADRLREHCVHELASGMHYEQRWLDLVPAYFDDVALVRDPGVNVGHWNLPDRDLRVDGDAVTVGGAPCRFVRFSGFDPARPDAVTRYNARLDVDGLGSGGELFRRYARLLDEAGWRETSTWPWAWRDRRNDARAFAGQVQLRARLSALANRVLRGIRE